jgi:limonene 1,2-monooxygenase
MKSFELFARWVMPRFQGSLDTVVASREWTKSNRRTIFSPNVQAIAKAYTDAGKPVPEEYKSRLAGARDSD